MRCSARIPRWASGFACGVNDLISGPGAKVTYVCAQEWSSKVVALQINSTTADHDALAHVNVDRSAAKSAEASLYGPGPGVIVPSAHPDPAGDEPCPARSRAARAAAPAACAADYADAATATGASRDGATGYGASRCGASCGSASAATAATTAPLRHLNAEIGCVFLVEHVERRQVDVGEFHLTDNDGGMRDKVLSRQILRRHSRCRCSACHCQ